MLEIEKKYSIAKDKYQDFKIHLEKTLGRVGTAKEVNTLYSGDSLKEGEVLRVREVNGQDFVLTHKDIGVEKDGIKQKTETEFSTENANCAKFLEALGYKKSLVYEKRRHTFISGLEQNLSICLDELPFGFYVELEEIIPNEGKDIKKFESSLPEGTQPVSESYPALVEKLYPETLEARF